MLSILKKILLKQQLANQIHDDKLEEENLMDVEKKIYEEVKPNSVLNSDQDHPFPLINLDAVVIPPLEG